MEAEIGSNCECWRKEFGAYGGNLMHVSDVICFVWPNHVNNITYIHWTRRGGCRELKDGIKFRKRVGERQVKKEGKLRWKRGEKVGSSEEGGVIQRVKG